MFRIPDGIDPRLIPTLQAIQSELFRLRKAGTGVGQGGKVAYYMPTGVDNIRNDPTVEVVEEFEGSYVIHGDLHVDGNIHGDINPFIIPLDNLDSCSCWINDFLMMERTNCFADPTPCTFFWFNE